MDQNQTHQNGVLLASPIADNADGQAVAASGIRQFLARLQGFNGLTFDRWRSNQNLTLLASGARTTTQTSADLTNHNANGIHVVLDMTVVGTGSVTLTIKGKDEVSGKYYTLLAGAAVTTNVTNVYKIYPGLVVAANAAANDVVPRTFQIEVVANNANSATYSVGYVLIV